MRVVNRSASFDYQLFERIECGVELTGAEAKSVRGGHVKLDGAHVKILDGQAILLNCNIFPYEHASEESKPDRTRKLLMHKKEILVLEQKMKTGRQTIVPTVIYTKGPRVKIEIALARGKRKYEKREAIKKRDLQREEVTKGNS